ncbi:triacylglycerol lipase [Bifidobacterium lemurum]|uniref:Triacylglycerol lipase n=1 Tax=Bifidobacterium lemurum TaxID=1603886 RepID=A0A261FTQ5_9BIFI|nr:Mbeg1-like protein [Bifidobacterium lemurum]OZG62537.1 triacylglycerol lipase [Bifidobacterium lemurum]QOL33871.1 DUF2974 domain-containing protein [Bifidobacterium lemurum]
MGTILDYARVEFRSFAELPFSAVDSLILSELAYIRMPRVVPAFAAHAGGSAPSDDIAGRDATPSDRGERGASERGTGIMPGVPITALLRAEDYPDMFVTGSKDVNDYRRQLLVAVAESPRWRNLRVGGYSERTDTDSETQFAAMTFDLSDCAGSRDEDDPMLYVAFRGTDGTLVGWKEDFNMAVRCPVPSQIAAADYLAALAGGADEGARSRLMVGGHSKGGNLAVYSALMLARDDEAAFGRIERVFTHDGPGLPSELMQGETFAAVRRLIDSTVPESSVIGMLLETTDDYTVVAADAVGIMQHMGRNWRVTDDGGFDTVPELNASARFLDQTIDIWLDRFSKEQRERAIDQIYGIFAAAGYETFAELAAHWSEALPKIAKAARRTDPSTRALLADVVKAFPATAVRSLGERVGDGVKTQQSDAAQVNGD